MDWSHKLTWEMWQYFVMYERQTFYSLGGTAERWLKNKFSQKNSLFSSHLSVWLETSDLLTWNNENRAPEFVFSENLATCTPIVSKVSLDKLINKPKPFCFWHLPLLSYTISMLYIVRIIEMSASRMQYVAQKGFFDKTETDNIHTQVTLSFLNPSTSFSQLSIWITQTSVEQLEILHWL